MSAEVLVIAGLDPAGQAGLLADADAVRAAGARPLLCAAATTIQTSQGLRGHFAIPAEVLERQILALVEEEGVAAVKLGMLGSAENARMLADLLRRPPLASLPWVIDPVLRASSGPRLFDGAAAAYRRLSRENVVLTPNLAEAGALADRPAPREEAEMRACAAVLLDARIPTSVPRSEEEAADRQTAGLPRSSLPQERRKAAYRPGSARERCNDHS